MDNKISIVHPIDFGIFQGTASFSCGFTIDEIRKIYKDQGCMQWYSGLRGISLTENCSGMALHRVVKKQHLYYIILKNPFSFTDEEMITLAHECIHLVQFILDGILDRDREFECEAYLHSYLMKQILKALRNGQ